MHPAANKPYYWNSSGESYIFYPQPMPSPAGEQWCRDNGGHLVSFTSEKEQLRVRGAAGQVLRCLQARGAVAVAASCPPVACMLACRLIPRPPVPHVHPRLQVEAYYITSGFLLPTFHKVYWTGLVSSSNTWPNFTWVSLGRAPPPPATCRPPVVCSPATRKFHASTGACRPHPSHAPTHTHLQVDNRTPGPSNSSRYYNHWGRFKPSKE
jgi:hypothetical protein